MSKIRYKGGLSTKQESEEAAEEMNRMCIFVNDVCHERPGEWNDKFVIVRCRRIDHDDKQETEIQMTIGGNVTDEGDLAHVLDRALEDVKSRKPDFRLVSGGGQSLN